MGASGITQTPGPPAVSKSPKLCGFCTGPRHGHRTYSHLHSRLDHRRFRHAFALDDPQSAGLLAISPGLSVKFPDEHAMLEQGMIVYDALYAWIKSARAEVHNANFFRKA